MERSRKHPRLGASIPLSRPQKRSQHPIATQNRGSRQCWVRSNNKSRSKKRSRKRTIGYLVGAGILVSGLVNSLRMQAIIPPSPVANLATPSPHSLSNSITPRVSPQSTTRLGDRDRQLFRQLLHQAHQERWFERQQNEQIQKIGEWFLGRPYQANLLEEPYQKAPIPSLSARTLEPSKSAPRPSPSAQFWQQTEPLVVSLQTFDCMIFVETVLALSQSAIGLRDSAIMTDGLTQRIPEPVLQAAEQTFLNQLEALRYREGIRGNYCSRLHYFSEWLTQQHDRRRLQPIFQNPLLFHAGNPNPGSPNLGSPNPVSPNPVSPNPVSLNPGSPVALEVQQQPLGLPWEPRLTFMTQHWQSYPALRQGLELRDCIAEKEAQWNLRWSSTTSPAGRSRSLRYLPTETIAQHYSELQAGDVVGIVTRTPGLDTTHTGFIYLKGNSVGLLHAAPKGGVQRSPDLASYVAQVRDAIGITVSRPSAAR